MAEQAPTESLRSPRFAILAILFAAIAIIGSLMVVNRLDTDDTISVDLGGERFTLQLAVDPDRRARGLMKRDHLDQCRGMLFAFPDQRLRLFWMKNCLIDLDVIYLDGSGRIVSIKQMKAPPAGAPEQVLRDPAGPHAALSDYPAQFAIELNLGTADKLGLSVGGKIDLPVERLKKRAR
jgi:uncharacterized membrane protein (UPF0127 family)